MRKLILILLVTTFAIACGKATETNSGGSGSSGGCGTHNGHQLYKGPDGGCYYINDNGNKTYVERSECRC